MHRPKLMPMLDAPQPGLDDEERANTGVMGGGSDSDSDDLNRYSSEEECPGTQAEDDGSTETDTDHGEQLHPEQLDVTDDADSEPTPPGTQDVEDQDAQEKEVGDEDDGSGIHEEPEPVPDVMLPSIIEQLEHVSEDDAVEPSPQEQETWIGPFKVKDFLSGDTILTGEVLALALEYCIQLLQWSNLHARRGWIRKSIFRCYKRWKKCRSKDRTVHVGATRKEKSAGQEGHRKWRCHSHGGGFFREKG